MWVEDFSVQSIASFCSKVPKRMYKGNGMGVFKKTYGGPLLIMLTILK